jgi:hypothetical protein
LGVYNKWKNKLEPEYNCANYIQSLYTLLSYGDDEDSFFGKIYITLQKLENTPEDVINYINNTLSNNIGLLPAIFTNTFDLLEGGIEYPWTQSMIESVKNLAVNFSPNFTEQTKNNCINNIEKVLGCVPVSEFIKRGDHIQSVIVCACQPYPKANFQFPCLPSDPIQGCGGKCPI